jgi:hypothetical protein
MNKKEKEINNLLVKAWNKFLKLKKQHPCDEQDFCGGIHQCQYVLGMRLARQYEPKIFPVKIK